MNRPIVKRLIAGGAVAAFALAAAPLAAETPAPVDAALSSILASDTVKKALADLKADDEVTFAEQMRITAIPAPPYKEKFRAAYFLKRMQELGFKDAAIDGEGNVIAT
ncbi:MAG TPA: peptidase M20, partial [Bradyrhizobium sp.]|nr:peptidase M20 [Bradyrhizobium sp.]